MSELNEPRWAVLSERGCEAMGLSYAEAREMMNKLGRERVSGLSIITDDAARHAAPAMKPQRRPTRPNDTREVRKRVTGDR